MLEVESNGSCWHGEDKNDLEPLFLRLEKSKLDWERFYQFYYVNNGKQLFFGNFLNFSHVFRFVTDDKEIIKKMYDLIERNLYMAEEEGQHV